MTIVHWIPEHDDLWHWFPEDVSALRFTEDMWSKFGDKSGLGVHKAACGKQGLVTDAPWKYLKHLRQEPDAFICSFCLKTCVLSKEVDIETK